MLRPRRSRGRRGLLRTLNLLAFLPLASRIPDYSRLLLTLVQDQRVPTERKAILAVALGYVALPVDLIPDWLPLVGSIDDVVVTVVAVDLFLEAVPSELLDEKLAQLGIDRSELDHDLARMRRLVPRSARRFIGLLPGIVAQVVDLVRQSGADRRLRTWILKEEGSA
jgi:uncharacterized membrane protein YkvA (DUF1232 family)